MPANLRFCIEVIGAASFATLLAISVEAMTSTASAGKSCAATADCPETCEITFHPTPDREITKVVTLQVDPGMYGGCTTCADNCSYGACYAMEVDENGEPLLNGSGGYCRPNGCHE